MAISGIVQGQGQGVPVQFSVKHGVLQVPDYVLNAASSAGAPLSYDTVNGAPNVVISSTGDTVLAGVLGEDFVDPSTLPADVQQNIFALGILKANTVGSPCSSWKIARLFLTNVTGSVSYGDFLKPVTGGTWETNTSTNPLKNGSVICLRPNTTSGGPIEVFVMLA
jgi:hypothetical protein